MTSTATPALATPATATSTATSKPTSASARGRRSASSPGRWRGPGPTGHPPSANELDTCSTEELAWQRRRSDAWFLAYFEQSFGHHAHRSLAAPAWPSALDTTALALEGGLVDRPPGIGQAGAHPELEELTPTQCEAHLCRRRHRTDRLFSTESGPVALPVNFIFAGGARCSSAPPTPMAGPPSPSAGGGLRSRSHRRGDARRLERAGTQPGPPRRGSAKSVPAAGRRELEPWAGGARLNTSASRRSSSPVGSIVQR